MHPIYCSPESVSDVRDGDEFGSESDYRWLHIRHAKYCSPESVGDVRDGDEFGSGSNELAGVVHVKLLVLQTHKPRASEYVVAHVYKA